MLFHDSGLALYAAKNFSFFSSSVCVNKRYLQRPVLTYFVVLCFTAAWGGARLSDVLTLAGVPHCTGVTTLGGRHVEFVSCDVCKVISFMSSFSQ
jgi:hypothetical protein